MRLAYLVPQFPCLSETFVSNEVAGIKASGIDLDVYAFTRPAAEDTLKLTDTARALAADTRYVDRLASMTTAIRRPISVLRLREDNQRIQAAATNKPNAGLRLVRAAALAERLVRDGVDHLHAHWPYATQVAWLVNQLTGMPFSMSIHAHEVAHENGHFPVAFRTARFAAFCNRGAMEYLLSRLGNDARERSALIYHGVNLSRFAAAPYPMLDGRLKLVSAGRLTRTKGFDRLLHGCRELRRRGIDVTLTILGRGTEEARLRELVIELGLLEVVHFPGWVPHDEVRRYIKESHVFALLADTSFHDGLPNVVLEAMATGRPVILSALPAAGEAVEDGVEGFLVDDLDSPAAFADAAEAYLDDTDRARKMGSAARRRIERDHDAGEQVQRLVKLFTGSDVAALAA